MRNVNGGGALPGREATKCCLLTRGEGAEPRVKAEGSWKKWLRLGRNYPFKRDLTLSLAAHRVFLDLFLKT